MRSQQHRAQIINSLKLILLFAFLVATFSIRSGYMEIGETLVHRFVAHSMIFEHNFDLDEFKDFLMDKYPFLIYDSEDGEKIPYFLVKIKGHYYSTEGVGPAILGLPLYFIGLKIFNLSFNSVNMIILTKFIASCTIALSAVFIFLSARLLSDEKRAWMITFIYALCSGMWSITSQQFMQQTGSELFIAVSIFLFIKAFKSPQYIPCVGFILAASVLMRPTNVITMGIMTIYVLHLYRSQFLRYLLCSLPVMLFIFYYNYAHHGSTLLFSLDIYNNAGALYKTGSSEMWSTPLVVGIIGQLLSPSRGLFIYSPVFIFSFISIIYVWKNSEKIIYRYFSVIVVCILVMHAKWYDWWGGWTFGNRTLNDCIPFLSILLVPFLDFVKRKKYIFWIFIVTIILSFFVQIVGAFMYDNGWNKNPNVDLYQERLWSWKDSQLLHYLKKAYY